MIKACEFSVGLRDSVLRSWYRTVEKTMIPDGKIIPLGLTLEKESQ